MAEDDFHSAERTSPDRLGGNALVTTRPALIDGSCGVDKDFLSPFTYCHSSHRRSEGARECARTVRNATIHKEPISISLMTAWRHSSASSSSCFLPGCQKRPAVKVRTTKLQFVHSPFCPQVGVGLFLAENVAWKLEWMKGGEGGPPIWRRIEGLHYNDDSDTTFS